MRKTTRATRVRVAAVVVVQEETTVERSPEMRERKRAMVIAEAALRVHWSRCRRCRRRAVAQPSEQ